MQKSVTQICHRFAFALRRPIMFKIGNYINRRELISLSVDLHKVAFSVSQSRNEIYFEINRDGSRQTIQSVDTQKEPDHDGWVFFFYRATVPFAWWSRHVRLEIKMLIMKGSSAFCFISLDY
jgi:hypothetical protein